MKVNLLDLTRQYDLLRTELEAAVIEQMASGQYIGSTAVVEFENKFASFVGAKHAIAVNSGTDALMISYRALGIGPGDEVITTPFTFFATAETISAVGATPVFADINPDTLNLDPDQIEAKITPMTKAIVPVHIFGQPADMDAICALGKKYSLKVIEDACQAVGALYRGRMVGSIGDCSCFSFFPTKNLGAFGDGGMITTNNDDMAIICRALREHGMAQNGAKARFILEGIKDDLANQAEITALYNPYKYYNYLIAYNSRLDALQARVLTVKLNHLNDFNTSRRKIAEYYMQALRNIPGIKLPHVLSGCIPVWHQFAICTPYKDELGQYLAEKQVGCAAFYPVPLHLQKAFHSLGYHLGDLPVAEKITQQTVCLPIFPELRQEEIAYVAECVKAFHLQKA